ncbi:CIA30 family protein [Maribacter halichondriae]|uniref:CIA30 family protein n=1 Tax=Maribacter halichondriae TaxID=2980554 RepID=UPI002359EEF4|nr:CIA30 family protein [Maribacter sp. Hal144]
MKELILIVLMAILYLDTSPIIFNGTTMNTLTNWYVLDDGVMGGLSNGSMVLNEAGNIRYTGTVRLENNGGFSSIRHRFKKKAVSKYTYVVLKIKGDGKTYQFRIKSDVSQRFSYINTLDTSGSWETVKLRLDCFYPSFRGKYLGQTQLPGPDYGRDCHFNWK